LGGADPNNGGQSRFSSAVSTSSSMAKGGVSALLKISISAPRISISPVGILLLTLVPRAPDLAHHPDHPLVAHLVRGGVDRLVDAGVEDHLHQARPIAQVDEHRPAQIPVGLDPTHHHHLLADVFGTEGPAAMSPFSFGDQLLAAHDALR
jgi:hypothetical protein